MNKNVPRRFMLIAINTNGNTPVVISPTNLGKSNRSHKICCMIHYFLTHAFLSILYFIQLMQIYILHKEL